jgi:hypothetical protein
MKRWALFAVVFATATLTALTGMTPVGASSRSPGSGDIIPWALQAEEGNVAVPLAKAKTDAGNFSVIIAHAVAYSGEVPAMKLVNPKLKVLMYMNGTFGQAATSGPGPATDFSQCPGQAHAFSPTSTWYETDKLGHFITNAKTGNCLMIPSNPLWIANRATMCATEAKAAGYDGCYLDDLGLGPLKPAYLTGFPINPTTHAQWTPAAWLSATAAIAKGVHTKDASSTFLVFGNGLTDGPSYYPPNNTKQILAGVDAGISEGWLRQASAPEGAFPPAAQWLQNVNMLVDAETTAKKPILTLTKLWSTSTAAQQTQWLQYSLASFLLGTQGKSMFFFSANPAIGPGTRTTVSPLYKTALGAPSGAYATAGGAYTRKFATGFVVVNPGTATVVVSLGGTYFTVPGGCGTIATKTMVTSVSMAKDTGCLLTTT